VHVVLHVVLIALFVILLKCVVYVVFLLNKALVHIVLQVELIMLFEVIH
jgi:hypothetical protein